VGDRFAVIASRAITTGNSESFICPWRTHRERATFLAKQARADIAGEQLAARLDAKLAASA
jgi:hypothetical protein